MFYKPLRNKKDIQRKIDPYKIWFFEGSIYIIGFCHLRNEVRTFVVDRIKLLRLTNEKFEFPDDFDFDEYTRHSFKVMHDELHTVKVRIGPTWARCVGEKIWHESQQTKKLSDGSVEITLRIAGLDEIKHWIMGFGPDAYVIEPERLKDMIRDDLKKALVQYQGARPVLDKLKAPGSKTDYIR